MVGFAGRNTTAAPAVGGTDASRVMRACCCACCAACAAACCACCAACARWRSSRARWASCSCWRTTTSRAAAFSLPSSARTFSTMSGPSVLMWFLTSTPSFLAICWITSLDMPSSLATS
jgi:hypothetical protein